jgi:hypothetical protein
VNRVALVVWVAILAAGCSGSHSTTLGGYGISLSLPHGWHGLVAPGQLQAADFPLARSVLASAQRARVPRGHVHVIVWDYGPAVSYLARENPPTEPPLTFRRRDVTGPLEGFPLDHAFAVRTANLDGEIVEILADLGPRPLGANRLRAANRIVETLKVGAFHWVRPRGGLLSRDRVSLRLPSGWRGRIEIPASTHFVKFVLRARRGSTHVALLDLTKPVGARQVRPPIVLTPRTKTFARSVVAVNGHTLEISATYASPSGLAEARRLVSKLDVSR